jgi:transposase
MFCQHYLFIFFIAGQTHVFVIFISTVIFKNNYYFQGHYLFLKIINGIMVLTCLESILLQIKKEIKTLEGRLLVIVKQEHQEILTGLKTILGIGNITAAMLVVLTDGFSKFETASQLCSYVGITPTTRESGSSVKGRPRISKVGNKKLRNLLFLCSFNACKHNKACRELYERIVNKGKSKKLALIAVANELLKQCFAIAKSDRPYDESYVSVLPK